MLSGEAQGAISFDELRARGRAAAAADPDLLGRIISETRPADYCILYLTSGATGEPKMGLVTHRSLVVNCDMGPKVLPVGEDDCTLAFLPSAHITQRMGGDVDDPHGRARMVQRGVVENARRTA